MLKSLGLVHVVHGDTLLISRPRPSRADSLRRFELPFPRRPASRIRNVMIKAAGRDAGVAQLPSQPAAGRRSHLAPADSGQSAENFWRDRGRGTKRDGDKLAARLDELEDPASSLSQLWDREHDCHLARRLLELLEGRFTESTREAFRRLVLEGKDAEQVAAELGLSLNAVFTAKSLVLRELRILGRGLLD